MNVKPDTAIVVISAEFLPSQESGILCNVEQSKSICRLSLMSFGLLLKVVKCALF